MTHTYTVSASIEYLEGALAGLSLMHVVHYASLPACREHYRFLAQSYMGAIPVTAVVTRNRYVVKSQPVIGVGRG